MNKFTWLETISSQGHGSGRDSLAAVRPLAEEYLIARKCFIWESIFDQKAKAARDLEIPHDLYHQDYKGLYIILEEFFQRG